MRIIVHIPAARQALQLAAPGSALVVAARHAGRALWEGNGAAMHGNVATLAPLRRARGGDAATGVQCDANEFFFGLLESLAESADESIGRTS